VAELRKGALLVAGGVENGTQGILGARKWRIWGILSENEKFFKKRVDPLGK